ncbi:MAG: HD domain-containing protein [Proteobacteria bacterium]|nr:HD domain-containing protein [Pseudomonadota bacterium]MBU1596595.1 HD domain-containing protein [Pseudomonadota bacterium]
MANNISDDSEYFRGLLGAAPVQGADLFQAVCCISKAMDSLSPVLANHHLRVCYIAARIALELDLPQLEQEDIALAALLHDVGGLTRQSRIETLEFDAPGNGHHEYGYKLLSMWDDLGRAAELVRHHHVPYARRPGQPMGCHILHLADRADVLLDRKIYALAQAGAVHDAILRESGAMFHPEAVKAFQALSRQESFWLDIGSPDLLSILRMVCAQDTLRCRQGSEMDRLLDFSKLVTHIIDFRSRFTATHSSGVAATAMKLAQLAGFSASDAQLMQVAGYLHDLGKIAVPVELLEVPRPLTTEEMDRVRFHPYMTYRILQTVPQLERVSGWAAFHHERPNGKGYPFHMAGQALSDGAKVMAVADVFTAITEDRPYRAGMQPEKAEAVMKSMADSGQLDGGHVELLLGSYDQVNQARYAEQISALNAYNDFYTL